MSHAKVVVTLMAVLMVVVITSAQTPQQAASTDTAAVQALTTEIRALRAELAESARTSLRPQLLTARIQAQEQRIIYLDRQRGEAATRRVSIEQVLQQAQVDENDAVNALSQEQSRWGDLNTRLEDLERTLGGR